MKKNIGKQLTRLILIIIFLFPLLYVPASPVMAAGTVSVTIVRYDTDGTTVLDEITATIAELEGALPVLGDGVTHYYHQGPTFDVANLWDDDEDVNLKDKGAVRGSDLKDICEAIGGMAPGDEVKVTAIDGFYKVFEYDNIYNPAPRQGSIGICWEADGNYSGALWLDGMMLVCFALTVNADGQNVFGNWDMHECFPADKVHYYEQGGVDYPSSNGYTIKNVSTIAIYTGGVPGGATKTLTMGVNGSGATTPSVGAHTYPEGDTVTVSAAPAAGWQFVDWTGDVDDLTLASTTVTMDDDKTVTANFVRSYNLNLIVSGTGATTPSAGSHEYAEGTTVTISATAGSGWQFVNWAGSVSDTYSPTTTIVMDSDETVTAVFSRVIQGSSLLTMNVNGSGSTIPSAGDHNYVQGAAIHIKAVPEDGWQFAGWTGNVTDPASADTTVDLDDDQAVTANFVRVFSLNVSVSGSGATSPSPGKHSYAEGTKVTISATPADGWEFTGWTGDVTGPASAGAVVTIDKNKTVTAVFSQKTPGKTEPAENQGNNTQNDNQNGTEPTANPATGTPADTNDEPVSNSDGAVDTPVPAATDTATQTIGVSFSIDDIDFGDIEPGGESPVKTITIDNTGSSSVTITLEIQGDDNARSFYEQSLYIDNALYSGALFIITVNSGQTADLSIQLRIPSDWGGGDAGDAVLVFWIEAAD